MLIVKICVPQIIFNVLKLILKYKYDGLVCQMWRGYKNIRRSFNLYLNYTDNDIFIVRTKLRTNPMNINCMLNM